MNEPAPSKEMEEKRKELARYFAGRLECTFSPSVYAIEHFDMALKQFAVELGKERESDADRIRWLETQREVECRQKLDAQNECNEFAKEVDQLKRELSEAQKERDQLKRENENTWRAHGEMFSRNLAISAAYQRQKEALNLALRAGDPEEDWQGIARVIQNALAETPDVSMWQPIESAPKDGTTFIAGHVEHKETGEVFWDNQSEAVRCCTTQELLIATHWMPLPPPPTLQPDHQK